MKANLDDLKARLQALKTAIFGVFGIHETLFLAGFGAFFYGMSGLWSLYGALAVCGAILMLVALTALLVAGRRAE